MPDSAECVVQGTGQGCTSTDGSDAVNLLDLHTAFHTKLYTAHLEVDLEHADNAPLPVDLVTPIDTSRRADEVQNQPAAFQTEARQASTTESETSCCWHCNMLHEANCKPVLQSSDGICIVSILSTLHATFI